jgi:transposase InsO family protein
MAGLENKAPMFVMRHRANSMITSASQPHDVWFVDSGASNHMTSHQEWFMNLREPERPGVVETGDDSTHMIQHIGDVALNNHDNKGYMKDVLHVPTITKNLVSVGQIVEQGLQVRFNQEGCFIEDKGQLIAHARREGRMFILDATEVNTAMYAKGLKAESDIELWHKRVGHVNLGKLRSMQTKGAVHGLPRFTSKHPDNVCEACQLGKQHRHPFLSERNVSKGLLDVIHSDVWGPAQTATIGGCRYFVTFIDDYSRHTWICPMKSKSEVFSHFLKLKNRMENETNRKIRCLRSDGGQEYFSTEFKAFLEEKGIRREFSCRYTPQQNGVAERKNRTILEMARAMLHEKNMPKIYWAEAAVTAVYLINRCTAEGVHDITPHEKYFGTKPNLSHLKVFGSIAFVHVPDEKRRKLDPKSEKMIFVGYSLEQKGYKCFNPITQKSRVSRDVVFDEVTSWYGPTSVTPAMLETSRSGADSESEEEEMLTTIMGGEPAESLPTL